MDDKRDPEPARPEGVPTEHTEVARWADLNPALRKVVLHALNCARADLAMNQAKSSAQQLGVVAALHDMAAVYRQSMSAEKADEMVGQLGQMSMSMMSRMQGADHALLAAFDLAIANLSEPQ